MEKLRRTPYSMRLTDGKFLLFSIHLLMHAHRIALAPPFPGLRWFKQGHKFQQWTGNDSKALMKVLFSFLSSHLSACSFVCSLPVLGLGVSN